MTYREVDKWLQSHGYFANVTSIGNQYIAIDDLEKPMFWSMVRLYSDGILIVKDSLSDGKWKGCHVSWISDEGDDGLYCDNVQVVASMKVDYGR